MSPFIAIDGIFFLAATMGSCKDTRSISEKQQDHSVPLVEFLAAMMGPSQAIGSIPQEKWQASL